MHRAKAGKGSHLLAGILAALLALALMPSVSAYAVGGASFNGEGATNVWEYDSVNVTAYGVDLFGAATKDLAPGDVRSLSVSLRNNAPDAVDFRLAARSLSTVEARYLEAAYPGKTADDSLLDAIDLTIRHGATTLYAGTLRGVSSSDMYSSAGVAIGRVSAGWTGSITVELSVRAGTGNALMDRLCAVEWVFIAAQYNDEEPVEPPTEPDEPDIPVVPGTPTTPGTAGTGGAGADTVVVIDDTPVSELPDEQTPTSPGSTPDDTPDVVIEADPVPQAVGGAVAWALLNLVLTGVSGLLMVALMARFLLGRRTRRTPDDRIATPAPAGTVAQWPEDGEADRVADGEEIDRRMRLKGLFWLVGIGALVVSVILFILTEDMTLPMRWMDAYTLWHVLIVLIEVALLLLPRNKRIQSPQQA